MANSRAEAILEATIRGETYGELPQSRLEKLLIDLNHSGGGGGGGTKDYNQLVNRPTLDGDVVEGDITQRIFDMIEPFDEEQEEELEDIIKDDEN